MKKHYLIAALSILSLASIDAAEKNDDQAKRDREERSVVECAPEPGVPCYPDDCCTIHCLGPENYGVNAPVCPLTCCGDWSIEVAALYWVAHEDGLEFAIDNGIRNPGEIPLTINIEELNNLVDAEYLTPHFKWNWGFKLGGFYCSPCDGWDLGILWTWYHGRAHKHAEAEPEDNHTLLPLWSAFAPLQGSVLYATDIESKWRLDLNLIDIELGRQFWNSMYVSLRPFIGVRVAFIEQRFHIENSGGSFTNFSSATLTNEAANSHVHLKNNFKGAGLRFGFDSIWNFGCGWAIYGDSAFSLVYGKFKIHHDETSILAATCPHGSIPVLSTEESFRATRGMLDLALGIQWSTLFCNCDYGFTAQLGWESHLFLNQNQLWRVMRIGDEFVNPSSPAADAGCPQNNTGQNVYHQRRGDLDTEGATLTLRLDF